MENHYNRENESDSDNTSSSEDDSSDDLSSSSESGSESERSRKRRKKGRKRRHKTTRRKTKHQKRDRKGSRKNSKKISRRRNQDTEFNRPRPNDICPLHGGHKWGKCRQNPKSENYAPSKPWQPPQNGNNFNRQNGNNFNRNTQERNQGGYRGPKNNNQNATGQQYHADEQCGDAGPPPNNAPQQQHQYYFGTVPTRRVRIEAPSANPYAPTRSSYAP
jgi:hypothetical protein